MRKLIKKLEDIMVAITFAEAGEYDQATRIVEGTSGKDLNGACSDFEKAAIENAGNK